MSAAHSGRTRGRWARSGVALLALAAGGCSYRAGIEATGAGGRPVARLGLDVFDNESRRPNLERELHAAMTDASRRWVDTRLTGPESAEVVVRGRILEADRLEGTRSRGNQVLETRETVRIEAELVDLRGARVVRRAETYVFVGTTLDVPDAEVDARARAIAVAADRLILLLLARQDEPHAAEASEGPPLVSPQPGA